MAARVSFLATLRYPDMRRMMFATMLSTIAQPMQFISLTFWAIDTFPGQAVLYPALVSGVRGIGMLGMAPVGGAIADRFERRRVILLCESCTCLLTALLGITMLTNPLGGATIVLVLVLAAATAVIVAVDQPSRAASLPDVVPRAEVGAAIGLGNVATQLAFPLVLPLAGFLNGRFDPGAVVLGSLVAWLGILPAVAALKYHNTARAESRASMRAQIAQGLRYTAARPAIRGVIMTVFVLHVIGMPGVGMLGPVWMRRILGLSPAEFGLIAMLWGLGALTGSFVCARYNHLVGRGTVVGASAMAFGAAALVFSLSREPAITAPANFALGFAMTATMTSSVIVVQHLVADEVRGRVMGLFPLVMGASMLNVLLIGALGQEFGLPVVVTTASATALAGAALILAWNRPFRAANASGPGARPAGAPGPPPLVPAPEDGG